MATQDFKIIPDRWRWIFAFGWGLLGMLIIGIGMIFGVKKPDDLAGFVYGAACLLTGVVCWWYWKYATMPLALRRLLYGALLIPAAVTIMNWTTIGGASVLIQLTILAILFTLSVYLYRFVSQDAYQYYFASFLGWLSINVVLSHATSDWNGTATWWPTSFAVAWGLFYLFGVMFDFDHNKKR